VGRGVKVKDSTNIWDAVVCALAISYYLAILYGTFYAVQFYGWSPWWFVLSVLLASGTKFRTGVNGAPNPKRRRSGRSELVYR
jgi:hypothetical protein